MSTRHPPSLRAAYARTHYRVRLARGGCATIRIGHVLPAALHDLLPHADTPWAFVTAWNPLSQNCPAALNHAHQRELLATLRQSAPSALIRAGTGVGVDAGTNWREPSLFVVDIDIDRLKSLMRPFKQHAIVCGHGTSPARLDWLQ